MSRVLIDFYTLTLSPGKPDDVQKRQLEYTGTRVKPTPCDHEILKRNKRSQVQQFRTL